MVSLFNRLSKDQQTTEPPVKRISTPAGHRLSVIVEKGATPATKARDATRASLRKSALLSVGEAPQEVAETPSPNSSGYSFNVWSGNETGGEKFGSLRSEGTTKRKFGWKRIALIVALIFAVIIAVVVGVVVGTKKKGHSSSDSADPTVAGAATTAAAATGGTVPNTVKGTPTSTATPASTPSNFPIGSYSIVTFLDTVQTNCTSNPSTWTCYPNTIYNTDPNKALATFNWIISSPKQNQFVISSSDKNPDFPSFTNVALELLNPGTDQERYRFSTSLTKTVTPSSPITDGDANVQCSYAHTTFQAYLYTRMAKGYPDASKGENSGNPTSTEWPFAARVEEAIGGGQDVPSCSKLNQGSPGTKITDGLDPQDGGALCSCLYKNWRTPGIY